ncbi:dUTP diphosphatase [Clostridium septicum]|uniref:dUTP diphosphatase n=1 Tax=Clostridium septicum TaxID=1504 RepID=A0A9N7JKM7_CLOSE|nr:dUTP diphosphatase [Clostridium septicum]AYE34289.1 dUTPase [Clostridium septicum]MDU1313314.1 dUTP diphosphatase [Clostridium septicum]QAS59683.1 dUTPase [Clostridium septicum]UEC21073.1 dUTP diphosphatase [Clostridium septicum]USS00878.1 dUTP diphosphatase [Clostridium septicum]
MDAKSLFEAQLEKNQKININSKLNQYKLSVRKNLDLHIKIGSLADETKCYKYWIDEDSSINMNLIFEKYLDCLGQILTIGLDKNYSDITDIRVKPNDYCLSDQFLNLYIDINDLTISPSKDHFLTLLEDFISLGITLGYSEYKIKESFINI